MSSFSRTVTLMTRYDKFQAKRGFLIEYFELKMYQACNVAGLIHFSMNITHTDIHAKLPK